jgi:carbon-monoxide dehydrogenase medium subunit
MAPGLLVLDAKVKVAGPSGNKEFPLEDFFAGPGKMNLARGEILMEIRIPFPSPHTKQIYLKHSIRRAMDIALVGVAVALSFDDRTKVCSKARLAFGAVAPTPVRAKKAEGRLVGKKIEEFSLDSVGEIAAEEVAPISDVRGSANYRLEMVKELTIEAIKRL